MSTYNVNKPGNLFVGYQRLRREIIMGLCNGNSYSIIGGRRCGKTSILVQLEKDLKNVKSDINQYIPLRISISEMEKITPNRMFETFYKAVGKYITIEKWSSQENDREYSNFIKHLNKVQPELDKKFSQKWIIVYLIDELDAAPLFLSNDRFFHNLRHFLMDSEFSHHFRIVATGVNELAKLIKQSGSPLNNLLNQYLKILSHKSAATLVRYGFSEDYNTDFLFKYTGKHPYLLQGILYKLKISKSEWSKAVIRKAGQQFLKETKIFSDWINKFSPDDISIYQSLSESPDGSLSFDELQEKHDDIFDIDQSLNILSYHGLINDEDRDEPEISCEMFKDWFLKKYTKTAKNNYSKKSEIYISYAWEPESEKFVNELEKTFKNKGKKIIRDKNALTYKDNIKSFMEDLGKGSNIVIIVSNKYLKSQNCMRELIEILKNGNFYDRIFPIVLEDADIYDPCKRIDYLQYWETKEKELDNKIKCVKASSSKGFRDEIDLYKEIKDMISELTEYFKNMNTLTPEMHQCSGFNELLTKIEKQ